MTDGVRQHLERGTLDYEGFAWRIVSDPQFRAELRFACDHGIPHSVFLGRVVGPGEPMWTDEDRARALAFEAFRAEQCSGCGLHPLQWPESEPRPVYEVKLHRCQGCRARADAEKRIPEGQSAAGVQFSFEKLDGPTLPGLPVPEGDDLDG